MQGKATGCFVDQSKIASAADAPVTAYYLWLPFLLTFCFGFAKMPRSLWRRMLEGGMLKNIMGNMDAETIAHNFIKFQPRFGRYHFYFGFCEFLNLVMVVLSMFVTDALLLNKFFGYGQEVFRYIWSEKTIHPDTGRYNTHDPMCELFPTEVSVNWPMAINVNKIIFSYPRSPATSTLVPLPEPLTGATTFASSTTTSSTRSTSWSSGSGGCSSSESPLSALSSDSPE